MNVIEEYSQQLHPAFAGYLQDGQISTRDSIACILYFIQQGYLDPIWKDHSSLENIVGLRRMHKKPDLDFETKIINSIFKNKQEIMIRDVNKNIFQKIIPNIIKQNLFTMAELPTIKTELGFDFGKNTSANFYINGKKVNTIALAQQFQNTISRIILPLFCLIGALFIMIFIYLSYNFSAINYIAFLIIGITFPIISISMYLMFKFSHKKLMYKLKKHVLPIANNKYKQLHTLLKKHPLKPHTFTNPYLAYTVAFGLDDSWLKDFGFNPNSEIKIENQLLDIE